MSNNDSNLLSGLPGLSGFKFARPIVTSVGAGPRSRRKNQLQQVETKGIDEQVKTAAIACTQNDTETFPAFSDWALEHFYLPDTVNQFGKQWDFTSAKKIHLEPIQVRIANHVLTPDKNGYYPYSTIVYSTIKKEGKTTFTGCVGAYWAAKHWADLILTLANDQEQSAGRIFGAMLPTLYALGCKVPMAQSSKPEVRLPNGTLVQAIANNYAGAAGANYSMTLWSELWAYTSERSRRLYDELVPVPTKKNSIRWIETYVGFEDESHLLLQLFKRIFTDTDESGIQPNAKPVPELIDITTDGKPACWHIPEEGLFYYHNHTPRMPWNVGEQGDKFRASQRADLRHSQYVRLWENRWQSAEGSFLEPDWYDTSITLDGPSLDEPMILAGDASTKHDHTALIGVKKYTLELFGELQERYKLCYVKTWDPSNYHENEFDLEETIAQEVKRLWDLGLIEGAFWYDPTQMHQVAVNLRKKKIPAVEFTQQGERLKADTFLWKQFKRQTIDLFEHEILEKHVKSAKVKEYENEQIRLIKGVLGRSNRIDACVALSMAVWKASQFRPKIIQKKTSSTYYSK